MTRWRRRQPPTSLVNKPLSEDTLSQPAQVRSKCRHRRQTRRSKRECLQPSSDLAAELVAKLDTGRGIGFVPREKEAIKERARASKERKAKEDPSTKETASRQEGLQMAVHRLENPESSTSA